MRGLILVLFVTVGLSSARWLRQGRSDQPRDTCFIGEATSEMSTAIFQGYIDDNKNIAFSPLGYSALLAVLAEGAKGETRQQLVTALHLPDDPNITRRTYRYIMERLAHTREYKYNQPELQNYFYIYKNYTINNDYKKILEEYYMTEVRSVEKYNAEQQVENDDDDDDDEGEFTIHVPEKKPEDKIDDIPELIPPKESDEKLISFALEDAPEKVDVTQMQYKPAKNIKEKIKQVKTYPKKEESLDDEETMIAVEARNHARNLKVLHENQATSMGLSVNSVGKESTSVSNSLMIIFNGMYFRGSWKQQFETVEAGIFYKSSSEKKPVTVMKTKGVFKTAMLPGLDSEAIQLPYEGDRYALLILLPETRDGLTRLIADLPSISLSDINDSLRDEELQVCLPAFNVETTTRPIGALAKLGVSNIFNRNAELSGVSSDEGLFVKELVQFVSVRVDNADSSVSEMSAANPVMELSKNLPLYETKVRRFSVDRPFIFFIVDTLDNLVVVAGKVTDPEQPTPFVS